MLINDSTKNILKMFLNKSFPKERIAWKEPKH